MAAYKKAVISQAETGFELPSGAPPKFYRIRRADLRSGAFLNGSHIRRFPVRARPPARPRPRSKNEDEDEDEHEHEDEIRGFGQHPPGIEASVTGAPRPVSEEPSPGQSVDFG